MNKSNAWVGCILGMCWVSLVSAQSGDLLQQGREALERGEYIRAEQLLTQVQNNAEQNHETVVGLNADLQRARAGVCWQIAERHIKNGFVSAAVASYREAMQIDPDWKELHQAWGEFSSKASQECIDKATTLASKGFRHEIIPVLDTLKSLGCQTATEEQLRRSLAGPWSAGSSEVQMKQAIQAKDWEQARKLAVVLLETNATHLGALLAHCEYARTAARVQALLAESAASHHNRQLPDAIKDAELALRLWPQHVLSKQRCDELHALRQEVITRLQLMADLTREGNCAAAWQEGLWVESQWQAHPKLKSHKLAVLDRWMPQLIQDKRLGEAYLLSRGNSAWSSRLRRKILQDEMPLVDLRVQSSEMMMGASELRKLWGKAVLGGKGEGDVSVVTIAVTSYVTSSTCISRVDKQFVYFDKEERPNPEYLRLQREVIHLENQLRLVAERLRMGQDTEQDRQLYNQLSYQLSNARTALLHTSPTIMKEVQKKHPYQEERWRKHAELAVSVQMGDAASRDLFAEMSETDTMRLGALPQEGLQEDPLEFSLPSVWEKTLADKVAPQIARMLLGHVLAARIAALDFTASKEGSSAQEIMEADGRAQALRDVLRN